MDFEYGCSEIENAYGGIDCDGDGNIDIEVFEYNSITLYARIVDKAAFGGTANGKTYKIPVTAELSSRDGVSKNTTIMIKVKVVQ